MTTTARSCSRAPAAAPPSGPTTTASRNGDARAQRRTQYTHRCGQCLDHYRDTLSLELLSARLQAERAKGQISGFTLGTLARELQVQGKFDEAEPLYREALEVPRESLGDRHPNTLAHINNLGGLLQAKGDLAAAEPLCRGALEAARETLGSRHATTLVSISNLGMLLKTKGDLAAAEPLLREAEEVSRETLGNRHSHTLAYINNLGTLLHGKGDLAAAEPLYREAQEVQRKTLGNRHPSTLASINNLGGLLYAKGDLAAAEPLLREALEMRRETLGERHPDTLTAINRLNALLTSNKGETAGARRSASSCECCVPRHTRRRVERCLKRQLLTYHESCARAKVNCEVGALRPQPSSTSSPPSRLPSGGRATHSAASSAVAKLPRCTCFPPLVTCVT